MSRLVCAFVKVFYSFKNYQACVLERSINVVYDIRIVLDRRFNFGYIPTTFAQNLLSKFSLTYKRVYMGISIMH